MSEQLQTQLERIVKRTYTIGLRFEGATRKERRQNELRANDIVKGLQEAIGDKITPEKMDETLAIVRQDGNLSGAKGAAKLAAYFRDRSNLGQIAYVTMLAVANGTFDRERKIQQFISFLQEELTAAVEWLVFGRTPYLEWKLQHWLQVAYDYSRNIIHSARRTIDKHLPESHQLFQPLPKVPKKALMEAIEHFSQSIEEAFAREEKLSKRQQSFLKKLTTIYQHRLLIADDLHRWLTEWNDLITASSTCVSRWWLLKQFTRRVEEWLEVITGKKIKPYSYLSVLRGCLVSALLPFYHEGETVKELIENGIICAEHLIAKPFRNKPKKNRTLIPLSLLMGSKYVVGRPGSSTVMTELASQNGQFTITIWPPRRRKEAVAASLRFHRRLREMMTNGARLTLLILRSTQGPAGKVLVDLVFEGQYWMFLSKRRFEKIPLTIQPPVEPVKGIGLDINRVGENMVVFSEEVRLPADMSSTISHYLRLEEVIQELHRALTTCAKSCDNNSSNIHQTRYKKLKQELTSVYARRARLLRELHRLSSPVAAQVLLQTNSPIFCVEDLQLVARGTRGSLAKAILSMPDEFDLYERAVLLVFWMTGAIVDLRRVDPRYTSQGVHVCCPVVPAGKVLRSRGAYDIAPCSACGAAVNTHQNAACLIRDKGLLLSSPC